MPLPWQIYSFVFVPLVVGGAVLAIVIDHRRRQPAPDWVVGRVTAAQVALAGRIARDEEDQTFHDWIAVDDGRQDAPTTHLPVIRPAVPEPRPDGLVVEVLDERTAAVLADPDLSGHDLDGLEVYTADGAGSVVSITRLWEDTRLRSANQQAALEVDEVEAWTEAALRDARDADEAFFAEFRAALHEGVELLHERTVRADFWAFYLHTGEHACPRCQEAVKENSAEHRQLVSMHDTGPIDMRELREQWAVEAAAHA